MIPSNILPQEGDEVAAPEIYGEQYLQENVNSVEWRGMKLPDMSGRCRDQSGNIIIVTKSPEGGKERASPKSNSSGSEETKEDDQEEVAQVMN